MIDAEWAKVWRRSLQKRPHNVRGTLPELSALALLDAPVRLSALLSDSGSFSSEAVDERSRDDADVRILLHR